MPIRPNCRHKYEVEEEPVERRMNAEGKFVQVVDGKEIVIERRNRDAP